MAHDPPKLIMSNIVDFRRAQHLRCASSPSAEKSHDCGPDATSPNSSWHAIAIEEVRNSMLMLNLAAQRARLMVMRISDQQARQNIIGQIETIERLLQLARDLAQRL